MHRIGRAMRGRAPAGQIPAELSRRGSSEGRSQGRFGMRHSSDKEDSAKKNEDRAAKLKSEGKVEDHTTGQALPKR